MSIEPEVRIISGQWFDLRPAEAGGPEFYGPDDAATTQESQRAGSLVAFLSVPPGSVLGLRVLRAVPRRHAGSGAHCADSAVEGGRLDLAVASVDESVRPIQCDALLAWQHDHPLIPVLLVVPPAPLVLARLSGLRVAALMWPDQLERRLRSAMVAAHGLRDLRGLIPVVQECSAIPPGLGAALAHALVAVPPIRKVSDLAGVVGHSRSTLEHEWRSIMERGPPPVPSLKALLDWIVVLRTLRARAAYSTWRRACAEVDVPPATFRRIVKRVRGCRPSDLELESLPKLLAEFRHYFVATLKAGTDVGECAPPAACPAGR